MSLFDQMKRFFVLLALSCANAKKIRQLVLSPTLIMVELGHQL